MDADLILEEVQKRKLVSDAGYRGDSEPHHYLVVQNCCAGGPSGLQARPLHQGVTSLDTI